jgi:hypothetical protein
VVLLAIAGGMALLGIYGVISYSVSQRTREIGTRIALGDPLQNVTGLFRALRIGQLLYRGDLRVGRGLRGDTSHEIVAL